MHKPHEIKLDPLPAPKIELINLIDVLITLIAFFLLTTVFNQQTSNLKINLSLAHQQIKSTKSNQLELQLDQHEKIFCQGTEIELPKLTALLQKITPDTAVIIKADRACHFQAIVDLLDLLKNSNLNKIAFAIKEK